MPSEYTLLFSSTILEVIVVLFVGFEVVVGELRHRRAAATAVTSPAPQNGFLLPRRIGLRLGLFIIFISGVI